MAANISRPECRLVAGAAEIDQRQHEEEHPAAEVARTDDVELLAVVRADDQRRGARRALGGAAGAPLAPPDARRAAGSARSCAAGQRPHAELAELPSHRGRADLGPGVRLERALDRHTKEVTSSTTAA